MAKAKDKDKAGRAKGKTRDKARQVKGKAGEVGSPGQARTTASKPAVLSVVPCALCRRPVHYEPGPGKAARALTDHYNDEHQGDERLKDLADGTGEVQRAVSPAYL